MSFKIFDRLYTLDSKKKIRVFDCRIEGGMYIGNTHSTPIGLESTSTDNVSIITATGLLGGKLIEQITLVKAGKNKGKKNETDVLAQAMLQADSLWREKLDEGYKTHRMLTGRLVSKQINESIYEEAVLSLAVKYCPEWAYTNSNWDELPMLAKKYKEIKNPTFPYLAQPKLNGVRCLVKFHIVDEENCQVKMISRGGTYYQVPHLQQQLLNLFVKIKNAIHGNFLLDGELYVHGIPLQDISGAARKEASGLFTANDWLEYHIYDVIDLKVPNETQRQRYQNLCAVMLLNDQSHIHTVNTTNVHSDKEVKELHDMYIEDGYEGLILRCEDSEYAFNERSAALLKVKQYQDGEFKIVGCEIDDTKTVGESFVFILKNDINELTFKARPTGTEEQKEYWLEHPEQWQDKFGTVRYFERSKDGLPQQGSVQHKLTEFLHIRPYGE